MVQHRDVILWALQRRAGGQPLNELWMKPDHWVRWMEMCGAAQERRAA
jgi:hypothetical protein